MASTSKNVLPSGGNLYVKSGSTQFKVAGSTGNLFHQAIALPNTTLIAPLANVLWPSTSQTITLLATTIASDAGLYLSPTSQVNPLATVTWPSTIAQTLVNTTVTAVLEHKSLSNGCAWKTFADTTATAALTPYGLHIFSPTTQTQTAYTLGLPTTAGAEVWLYDNGGSTVDKVTITATSDTINGDFKTIVLNRGGNLVHLIGVSTVLGWAIVDVFPPSTLWTQTPDMPTFTTA